MSNFVLMDGKNPLHFIECKTLSREISQALRYLKIRFPDVKATQVVMDKNIDLVTKDDIRLCAAQLFLKDLV